MVNIFNLPQFNVMLLMTIVTYCIRCRKQQKDIFSLRVQKSMNTFIQKLSLRLKSRKMSKIVQKY